MPSFGSERRGWDATATLEALGGAEVVLWTWEPDLDRLRVYGPARGMGLGPLAPECSSAAFRSPPNSTACYRQQHRQFQQCNEAAAAAGLRGGQCAAAETIRVSTER